MLQLVIFARRNGVFQQAHKRLPGGDGVAHDISPSQQPDNVILGEEES
jgi:hypothetical protein